MSDMVKVNIEIPTEIYNKLLSLVERQPAYKSPEFLIVDTLIECFSGDGDNSQDIHDNEIPF